MLWPRLAHVVMSDVKSAKRFNADIDWPHDLI